MQKLTDFQLKFSLEAVDRITGHLIDFMSGYHGPADEALESSADMVFYTLHTMENSDNMTLEVQEAIADARARLSKAAAEYNNQYVLDKLIAVYNGASNPQKPAILEEFDRKRK